MGRIRRCGRARARWWVGLVGCSLAVMLVAPEAAQATTTKPSISLASQSGGTYDYQLTTGTVAVTWFDAVSPAIVLSGLSGVTGASLSGDLAGGGSNGACALSVSHTATSVTVSQGSNQAADNFCVFDALSSFGTLEVDSSAATAGTVNWATENTNAVADASGTVQGPVANTVTVTNPGNQTGPVGTAVSLQISASDSASGQTLTYSASGLPTGLSISSSSGLISGTPTTASTYNVAVTATDTTGASGNASFTWTVSPPPASALAATLVSDSTGKGPGKALQNKAAAIEAAVNANPPQTATACADITDYLDLVKAQTNKKLTEAQANQLTTDANNLAAALGC